MRRLTREEGGMRRRTKATLALPLALLLLGLAVPIAVRPGSRADAPPPAAEPGRRAGRTGAEWRELAVAALEDGRHDLALRRIKTAESLDPGRQYAREIREIRTSRRNARGVERARRRLIGGGVEHIELDARGSVLVAYRTAVVLPGESQWTIARTLAALEEGSPTSKVASDDPRVFRYWDQLTDLNGLRELEVGERVRVPILAGEREAIASANSADLARIADAEGALRRGDVGRAVELGDAVRGTFALSTPEFGAFNAALTAARREALVEAARRAVSDALAIKRTSGHARMIELLASARDALAEAERLGGDVSVAEERAVVEPLLEAAARYRVLDDGSIAVRKPPGVTYADAARKAVEWFLDRRLASSGAEFPHQDRKTTDEIGWARFLCGASDMATRRGVDFAALLESDSADLEVLLPNPGDYFSE
jgi:hypothetical protein